MAFQTKVLADSISPKGVRLVTVEATYPRIVHAEWMTHRVLSRNSASTRAIPLASQLRNLLENPFIPEKFGINQPGMQAYRHLVGLPHEEAMEIWLAGRDRAITTTIELSLGRKLAAEVLEYEPNREYVHEDILREKLDQVIALMPKSTDVIDPDETIVLNVHKQLAGRGLEAYMWHTVIYTATEWSNLFALRIHPEAQGEITKSVRLTKEALDSSEPRKLEEGQWHLPFVDEGEFGDNVFDGIRASAARCAAVSYNRQSAKNPEREFARYADLRSGGHMSPLEHQATPFTDAELAIRLRMVLAARRRTSWQVDYPLSDMQQEQLYVGSQFLGNLRGWRSHRKDIPFENDFSNLREE